MAMALLPQSRKNMASADTNVLLRWVVDDIPAQTKAAAKLLKGAEVVHVADAAIIEMVYVLEKVYGFSREIITEYTQAVMSLSQVNCNRTLFARVLPIYVKNRTLSIVDCSLAVYAEIDETTPLYTFDKQLSKKLASTKELV